MNEINKGFFEEIKELDEEQNYSSGFNSQRSGDKGINESKYSQIKGSVIDEEDVEEVFTDEESEAPNSGNDRETGDFVNLETPMGEGKNRGIIEKESQSGIEGESSGDEVNMFEFKASPEEEEIQKKLIVSEAFVEDNEEENQKEENQNEEEEFENSKPGDKATPNTPLIEKCRIIFNIYSKIKL